MKRLAVAAAVVLAATLSSCSTSADENGYLGTAAEPKPVCSPPNESIVLIAQAVQDATRLPCIRGFPSGWSYAGDDIARGSATYWLSSAVAGYGSHAVQVQLLPSCEPSGEPLRLDGAPDVDGYVVTDAQGETRTFVFEGGCIVQTIAIVPGTDDLLTAQARTTLGFLRRDVLAGQLEQNYGVTLCGAGAEACVG